MAGWKKLLFIGGGGLVPGAIIGFRFQYYKRIEEKEVRMRHTPLFENIKKNLLQFPLFLLNNYQQLYSFKLQGDCKQA